MPIHLSSLPDSLLSRAELYLCLAKVFSASELAQTSALLKSDLLPDLKSLANELPAISTGWLAQFEVAVNASAKLDSLMSDYGRLFLMPPAPAPLNLGFYLDVGISGNCGDALESYYHQYALEKSADFHDLPDHLSLNLQWFAWVLAGFLEDQTAFDESDTVPLRDVAEVIANFTLPAVNKLCVKAEAFAEDKQLNRSWLLLLNLVRLQLQDDLRWLTDYLPEQPEPAILQQNHSADLEAHKPVAETQFTCAACQKDFLADEMLSGMILRLEEAGVGADHVKVCPVCKGQHQEPTSLIPPGAKRFGKRAL